MSTNNEKSILIIAPSLFAESLSLKLTSLDRNLNVYLDTKDKKILEYNSWRRMQREGREI